jgi:hypothetical protein
MQGAKVTRFLFPVALCAAFLVSTVPAKADFIASANINAAQELDPITGMPPVSSATGTFSLDYSPATMALTYTLTFSGLTSPTTMAHIHLGPPGLAGAILFPLYDYGMPPSMNVTSNTLSGTLTAANFMPDTVDGIGTFAQAIAAIETGDTYVNIHTTNYPAGEIRGQILATPEPASASLLLLGAGLGAFGLSRRKRTH